jgi:AraC-like DNA-binding protein
MSDTNKWPDEDAIDRLIVPISENVPIVGQYKIHPVRRDINYDMHFGLEFGILLSGKMHREYRGWSSDFKPGDVWFCGIWEPHGWSILRAPCQVVVLVIHPQITARMRFEEASDFDALAPFTLPPELRPQTTSATRSRVIDIGKRIWSICENKPTYSGLWLRLLLLESLLLFTPLNNMPRPHASIEYAGRINRAIEAVYRQRRMISATEAARLCGMSKIMFNKTFVSIMGISFPKFSLRYRLQSAAAQLLHDRDEPLKVAASEWGFTDSSHLYQCFLKHFGCSPTEYRNRMSNR